MDEYNNIKIICNNNIVLNFIILFFYVQVTNGFKQGVDTRKAAFKPLFLKETIEINVKNINIGFDKYLIEECHANIEERTREIRKWMFTIKRRTELHIACECNNEELNTMQI